MPVQASEGERQKRVQVISAARVGLHSTPFAYASVSRTVAADAVEARRPEVGAAVTAEVAVAHVVAHDVDDVGTQPVAGRTAAGSETTHAEIRTDTKRIFVSENY